MQIFGCGLSRVRVSVRISNVSITCCCVTKAVLSDMVAVTLYKKAAAKRQSKLLRMAVISVSYAQYTRM